jgi:hypothetical protein
VTALQQVHLAPQVSDYRGLTKEVLPFTFQLLYSLTAPDVPTDVFPSKIWNNTTPPKCKHLLWLVHHNRLPCRASLHDHNIAGSSACAMCGHREDEAHLSLHYVHAKGDLRKAWTATCFIMFRDYVYLEPPLSSPYCRKSCRPLSSLRCCGISGKKRGETHKSSEGNSSRFQRFFALSLPIWTYGVASRGHDSQHPAALPQWFRLDVFRLLCVLLMWLYNP